MERSANHLATAPVGKLLFRLSIPTIAAQLINLLYNVVDRIYIGHIPEEGSLALTGVGVCLPIILIISAFASLLRYSLSSSIPEIFMSLFSVPVFFDLYVPISLIVNAILYAVELLKSKPKPNLLILDGSVIPTLPFE